MQIADQVLDFIQEELIVVPDSIDADRLVFTQDEVIVSSNESIDLDTPLLNGVLSEEDLLRLVKFLEESYKLRLEPSVITAEHFESVLAVDHFVNAELSRISD